MRISHLAAEVDLPVATVKYYLRSGLLPPGELTSATQATYEEHHVQRLRLVRALIEVARLSHEQVKDVLRVLDSHCPLVEALGAVHGSLPPQVDARQTSGHGRAVLDRLGWWYEPDDHATRQLDQALDAASAAGLPVHPEHVEVYARAALDIAAAEIAGIPRDSYESALTYTALGTVLYEPVLLALRRLAEAHVAVQARGD